ncbi:hypothetical protein BV25DRAFT_1819163 [Artomyces pyxidatus]|uniref:Uncharacterized protein n=1 Tax=Artomyces pyxidatus TaxID=48021 RepID=A0ACB8TGZ5_9AGAM|nr:hypothetical protein BV25DRAFT_1819163 [Artomyces pyxidatus]
MASSAPLPPDNHSPPSDFSNHPHSQPTTKSLLASTWQVLDQPPPPSLREILGAYRTRGDGDREMLMAMLNAKSAEDQRIASVASLHRSMLEYYQAPPPRQPSAYESPYPTVLDAPMQYNGGYYPPPTTSHHPPSRSPHHSKDARQSNSPRKRPRTSESPSTSYNTIPTSHVPSSPPNAPSSPYSSTRSDSAGRSPRSRDAMAIGSLLTAAALQPRDDVDVPLRNGVAREERSHHRTGSSHSNIAVQNPVSV